MERPSGRGQSMATGCDVTWRHTTQLQFTIARNWENEKRVDQELVIEAIPPLPFLFSHVIRHEPVYLDRQRHRSGVGNYRPLTVSSQSPAARLRRWLPELIRTNRTRLFRHPSIQGKSNVHFTIHRDTIGVKIIVSKD